MVHLVNVWQLRDLWLPRAAVCLRQVEHFWEDAARGPMTTKVRVLPRTGRLMVSTDLHGNAEDFRRLRDCFLESLRAGRDAHWAILGDLVHGPSVEVRQADPELYGFADESWAIVDGVRRLREAYPDRIHLVLGNHDYGHLGGFRTSKFHPDEVAFLEEQLSPDQLAAMKTLFAGALLLLLAPCGLVLAHGSPGDMLRSPEQLLGLTLGRPRDAAEAELVREILTSYGQTHEVTERMLQRLRQATGLDLRLVIHGHDRAEEGWFTEGDNQLQPVLFGAPKSRKRYLEIDLAARYESLADLREDKELRLLYPA